MHPAVDIILPCLDEAAAIPWVMSRIPYETRAIIVDNGSTDKSPNIARNLGAMVIQCPARGYGAACQAGLAAATADIVAFCDCDGSLNPADVLRLVAELGRGADLVMCRRIPVSRAAWPWPARLANLELARRVRKRTGARIADVGPLRVASRRELLALKLADRRSGYPVETVVRAADAGWRIVQVDVDYHVRIGRSKVTGTVRGSYQAVRDMSAVLSA